RGGHLDQLVAHHGEAAVGAERGDAAAERDLEAVRVGRGRSAEGGEDLVRGEEGRAGLLRSGDRAVAGRRAQRRLRGDLREDEGGEKDQRNQEDGETLHSSLGELSHAEEVILYT